MDEPGPRHNRFLIWVGFPIARAFVWLLFLVLGPLRVRGRTNVPREGGLLILSNHLADVDPIVVQYASPRPVYFMAKSELFAMRGLGKIIRWFRAFPVKRGEPDRAAIKTAIAYCKSREVVGVFPEGELSESGELLPLKAGVVLIIRAANVPVICCRLKNTNRVLPYGKFIPRISWSRVTAEWSEPRTFEHGVSPDEVISWAQARLGG